jgi:hypothetical protein
MAINNETYFEFDNELNEGFTTIPNYILNDTRLTYKAVGVYVQILQYRNTGRHKVYLKSLAQYRQDKKTAVSTALKELEVCGYISKEYIRNDKGQMKGMKYIVRMKPIAVNVENTTNEPKSENLTSENPTSDFTLLKIKCFKKENDFKKENVVDVVVDDETSAENLKEKELVDLYKSFKIEKRVMPHMVKLLKENIHIDLDVFEQIFISTSSEDVKKKYSYLKTILDELNKNNIKTLSEFNDFNNKFKEDKNSKDDKNSKKDKNNKVNVDKNKIPKTKFHNFNQREINMTEKEFEDFILSVQKEKFKQEDLRRTSINDSLEEQTNNFKENRIAPPFNPNF